MADEFLGKDFQAKTFPFRQPVPFETSANSAVPWGQAIVDEAFESQVIGAGDTGTLNIDIQVPNDYVSLLRSFHLQATDTTSNLKWANGVVGLAYQQPGGPYKLNNSDLPERDYLWWPLLPDLLTSVRDRFSTTIYYKNFDVGFRTAYTNLTHTSLALNNPENVPLWLPPGDASIKERAMVIYLNNETASQPANSFRLNVVFDLYTQEQAYAAGVMSSPRVFS